MPLKFRPLPQNYINAMGGADGAAMTGVAKSFKRPYGGTFLSKGINYDQIGMYYQRGYSLFSTTDAHVVNLRGFTVSNKFNLFFGGTHSVIGNVSIMNPLTGSITSGSNFMRGGSFITWIKW